MTRITRAAFAVAACVALAGCGHVSYGDPASQATPAISATAPDIVTECQIVNYPQPDITALDNAEADNFNGPGEGSLLTASADGKPPAYQITLNNNGATPVGVDGIITVLFAGTAELVSDRGNIGQLLSPGASLTFTFPVPSSLVTSQTDDWGNPVDYVTNASNCQVEQWN